MNKPLALIAVHLWMGFMCWVLVGCITGRLSEKTYEWRMRSRFRWFLMPGPLATNGYGAAIADYGAQFFANTTKAEWSNSLAAVSGKLGDYQGYSVIGWRASKRVGPGGGTYVELRCRTSYSKYAADESFTLFKG